MADYSNFTTEELQKMQNGDYSNISTDKLSKLFNEISNVDVSVGEQKQTIEEPKPIGAKEAFGMGFAQKELPEDSTFKQKAAHFVGENILPTVGGIVGQAANILPGAGIPASAALAGAGRAAQKGLAQGLYPEYTQKETLPAIAGDVALQAGTQYLGGKLIDPVFKKASTYLSQKLPKLAERLIESRIKPKGYNFAYGKNPGKGILDDVPFATSLPDLINKIKDSQLKLGSTYNRIFSNPKNAAKRINLDDTIKVIDNELKKLKEWPSTNAEAITRIEGFKAELLGAAEDPLTGKLTINYSRKLKDLTPREVQALKEEIGNLTKYTGNMSDDNTVNLVKRRVYTHIDNKLDSYIPSLKKVNEKFANLMGALKASEHRHNIERAQNVISLPTIGTGVAGALLHGTPGAIAAAGAYQLGKSTIGKTGEAQLLKGTGKLLGSKAVQTAIPAARAIVAPSVANGMKESPREAPSVPIENRYNELESLGYNKRQIFEQLYSEGY